MYIKRICVANPTHENSCGAVPALKRPSVHVPVHVPSILSIDSYLNGTSVVNLNDVTRQRMTKTKKIKHPHKTAD
jgi:hypothetical protein